MRWLLSRLAALGLGVASCSSAAWAGDRLPGVVFVSDAIFGAKHENPDYPRPGTSHWREGYLYHRATTQHVLERTTTPTRPGRNLYTLIPAAPDGTLRRSESWTFEMLVESGVNILAISVPDTGEFGTVRLLPDDLMEARAALEEAGYPHSAVDVLAVELPHEPGSLAKVARLLAESRVVIQYAYATRSTGAESGLCVLRVDNIHVAREVLDKKLN